MEKIKPIVHIASHGYRPWDSEKDLNPPPPEFRPRRNFTTQLKRHFRAFAQGNGIQGNDRYAYSITSRNQFLGERLLD